MSLCIGYLILAKSRVKKFWNKGKSNGKLSGKKSLSLSQPNLAALDPSAEIKPITMYEMRVGHSVDGKISVIRSFSICHSLRITPSLLITSRYTPRVTVMAKYELSTKAIGFVIIFPKEA